MASCWTCRFSAHPLPPCWSWAPAQGVDSHQGLGHASPGGPSRGDVRDSKRELWSGVTSGGLAACSWVLVPPQRRQRLGEVAPLLRG